MMYSIIRKILFLLPPEKAHHLSLVGLKTLNTLNFLNGFKQDKKSSPVQVMGLEFPNRIGLAAGLDKNGDYIQTLAGLGFGFVELGTVTPRPQAGNPKPRLFRLPKAQAIINRMGFNNEGVDYLVARVTDARNAGFTGIIGINIGKNIDTKVEDATQDYLIALQKAYLHASYITVNISSPNTPGLRSLQYGEELNQLLQALKAEQKKLAEKYHVYKPIAVKVAPDLTEEEVNDIAGTLLENNIDALIATNTTLSRDAVKNLEHGGEAGGLSGEPVKDLSTKIIQQFHNVLQDQIPIIGVGGIASKKDVQDKLDAGAVLVQIYSGLIYKGPSLVKQCL